MAFRSRLLFRCRVRHFLPTARPVSRRAVRWQLRQDALCVTACITEQFRKTRLGHTPRLPDPVPLGGRWFVLSGESPLNNRFASYVYSNFLPSPIYTTRDLLGGFGRGGYCHATSSWQARRLHLVGLDLRASFSRESVRRPSGDKRTPTAAFTWPLVRAFFDSRVVVIIIRFA